MALRISWGRSLYQKIFFNHPLTSYETTTDKKRSYQKIHFITFFFPSINIFFLLGLKNVWQPRELAQEFRSIYIRDGYLIFKWEETFGIDRCPSRIFFRWSISFIEGEEKLKYVLVILYKAYCFVSEILAVNKRYRIDIFEIHV